MALYAIADLHLGLARNKSMDRFGPRWHNHVQKIVSAWQETVTSEDTVLMPGDISWAMRWPEFEADLQLLASLPGAKIISRGNHDFYWLSKTKMKKLLPSGIVALDQSWAFVDNYVIAAIKGWLTPEAFYYNSESDEKFYNRERKRLENLLREVSLLGLPIIVQMHFPPWAHPEEVGFSEILEDFKVKLCIYGHLHSGHWTKQNDGEHRGVRYRLVSADYLSFRPLSLQNLLLP